MNGLIVAALGREKQQGDAFVSMVTVAKNLRHDHWLLQKVAGISIIPSNDFSLYDQVLDALVLIGATPERFTNQSVSLTQYFAMARNSNEQTVM